jgi:hypothetical protein
VLEPLLQDLQDVRTVGPIVVDDDDTRGRTRLGAKHAEQLVRRAMIGRRHDNLNLVVRAQPLGNLVGGLLPLAELADTYVDEVGLARLVLDRVDDGTDARDARGDRRKRDDEPLLSLLSDTIISAIPAR